MKLSSEPGLLSIAFAPDYATSGRLYAFYNSTAGNGDIHISEFHRHATDPDLADVYTERILLDRSKPWENHNGGMLQFGPDGYLYASIGDGDSGVLNPPGFFAQSRDDLLGNILRIDPTREPYAIPRGQPVRRRRRSAPGDLGVRPPQPVALLDRRTRPHDVRRRRRATATREEVDVVRGWKAGLNFGWPCFEGTLPFDCATCTACVDPVAPTTRARARRWRVRRHRRRRRPRPAASPALAGRYLYGDFCAGRITAVAVADGRVASTGDLGDSASPS